MVNRPLSPRDLELLSAYLDRQLSSHDQQRLEERLRSNPGLRIALDEMRRTRAMLRSLPKVRAPRNFTLTPAMLPSRGRNLLFGMPFNWSAASALATLFLIVFFAGDFLGLFSPRQTMQTAQTAPEAQALETAMNQIDRQAKATAEDMQSPGLELPVAPDNARGMGGGGGEESEATLQTAPVLQGTPQSSADLPIILATPTPTIFSIQPMLEMPVPAAVTDTLSAKSAPETEVAFASPTGEAPLLDASQPEISAPPQVLYTPVWVRIIEVALLLVAIAAGVFAFSRRLR